MLGASNIWPPEPLPSPYSVRIPAAIKKAEELLGQAVISGGFLGTPTYYIPRGGSVPITATEVALAKALWEMFIDECAHDIGEGGLGMNIEDHQVAFPALIAFTEKVESL